MSNPLVIFDCDGTLIDSMPFLTDLAVEMIVTGYKISETKSKSLYQSTIGIPFYQQLETLFPHDQRRNKIVAEEYEEHHRRAAPYFSLSPRLGSLTVELHQRKFKTAVVSSTNWIIIRDCLPQLEASWFDSKDGFHPGHSKLNQIDSAIRKLDADINQTIYVGDSQFDKECALLSGIPFIRVTTKTLYDNVMYAAERVDLKL